MMLQMTCTIIFSIFCEIELPMNQFI